MRVFVLLFAVVAFASAWTGRDVNDWGRDRFVYRLGLDDRVNDRSYDNIGDKFNKRIKNFDDSREKLFGVGVGVDSREKLYDRIGTHNLKDTFHRTNLDSIENTYGGHLTDKTYDIDHSFTHRTRVVDNVDKKYAKYDDDLKVKLLGDNLLLVKQKFILDILRDVFTVRTDDDNLKDVGRLVDGELNYKNFDKVIDFFRLVKTTDGFLPRGRVFTIKNKVHHKQVRLLFSLFVYSKNFDVFKMNVLWARKYFNEEMFVYALYAAVIHRDDLIGVKLPAIYEILPHKFHTSLTIDKALKLKDDVLYKTKDLTVLNKYTSDYITLNDEGKLTYLTEDIGWNTWNFFFHLEFASFVGGKDFKLDIERRGEKYLYLIHKILARYNLERLSQGLGEIKDISLWDTIKTGYNPLMKNFNGLPFSYRTNYYDVRSTDDYFLIDRADDFERRIRDSIDKGYVTSIDGGKIDLQRWDGVDVLGNIIHGNVDSVNTRFYGGFVKSFIKLLSGGYVKNQDVYKLTTTVMDHHETILRDPVTYQLLKRIIKLYFLFKDYLPTYKTKDLVLDGVQIKDIKTTSLVTYFDFFDVDITNILRTKKITDRNVDVVRDGFDNGIKDNIVRARHVRLNHKPFSINMDLVVDQPQKVVIRTFLGPKYDFNGKLIDLRRNRDNFVEIDKYTYDLKTTGHVRIDRHSRDFVYTVKDRTTILDIYKKVLVNNDLNELINLHVDEANCGFPDRLVLPKGWVGGFPLQIFVIVTKAKDVIKKDINHTLICGKKTLINEVDDEALGFPFDRRIDLGEFFTKNMLFKDVFVFHDVGDIQKIKDIDGKVFDSREFLDIVRVK